MTDDITRRRVARGNECQPPAQEPPAARTPIPARAARLREVVAEEIGKILGSNIDSLVWDRRGAEGWYRIAPDDVLMNAHLYERLGSANAALGALKGYSAQPRGFRCTDRAPTLDELCAAIAAERDHDKRDALLVDIRLALLPGHREQLEQLIKRGPVWDGDVISKVARGDLVRWKLAARVLVNGEWGYTAATYLGGHVLSDRVEVTS